MKPIRIGIIGAGAVTELHHLPAAQLCPEVQVSALVDKNRERAETLAGHFALTRVTTDYHELFGQVDGVINALPNYLHAPVTVEFLEKGVPVLVEKPMALTVAEAEGMVRAAKTAGVILQAGYDFRFAHGARLLKRSITEGWLGHLQRFDLEWGFVGDWPMVSGFFFTREHAGGGVLTDRGSHMLDLLLWWLGGVVDVIEYRDDSLGGVEADCWLSLVLQSPTGPVQGSVRLSRQYKLRDTVVIRGDRLTIDYDLSDKVRIRPSTGDGSDASFVSDSSSLSRPSPNTWVEQLRVFARAIATGGESAVPGESVLGCVALIEQCYRQRQPLELPWENVPLLAAPVKS